MVIGAIARCNNEPTPRSFEDKPTVWPQSWAEKTRLAGELKKKQCWRPGFQPNVFLLRVDYKGNPNFSTGSSNSLPIFSEIGANIQTPNSMCQLSDVTTCAVITESSPFPRCYGSPTPLTLHVSGFQLIMAHAGPSGHGAPYAPRALDRRSVCLLLGVLE